MVSPLPHSAFDRCRSLVLAVDEYLQAEAFRVGVTRSLHAAFDNRPVASTLARALVRVAVLEAGISGIRIVEVGNLGIEAVLVDDSVERRLRFRSGVRNAYGELDVRVGSDSFLKRRASTHPSLFDDAPAAPGDYEQWVVPYLLDRSMCTLVQAEVGFAADVRNASSPFKLVLDHRRNVPLHTPTPPGTFMGDIEDLDLGEDDEFGDGESTAG